MSISLSPWSCLYSIQCIHVWCQFGRTGVSREELRHAPSRLQRGSGEVSIIDMSCCYYNIQDHVVLKQHFKSNIGKQHFQTCFGFSVAQNWGVYFFKLRILSQKQEKMCCLPKMRCSKPIFSFPFWKKGHEHGTPCENGIFGLFFGSQ